MSDIFATLAAGTARATATTGGESAVRVVDPSPELSRLAIGESLRGTVVGKDDHGHLLVRTRIGVLQLATPRALPVGSEVVLQVRSVGPQVMMSLLPLEAAAGGSTPAPAPSAASPNAAGPGAAGPGAAGPGAPAHAPPQGPAQALGTPQTLPPTPHDLVQTSQVLRGVLHAAPPVPLLAGLPTAQPGAELTVRILALGVQSQAAANAAGAAPAGATPVSGAPAVQPSGQAGPVSPGATTQGGTTQGSPAQGSIAVGGAGSPAAPPGGTGAPAQAGGATGHFAPGPVNSGPGVPGPVISGSGNPGSGNPGSGNPGSGNPGPGSPTAAAGLRLAPQTPVANSGHSVASALQGLSSEAASRAAGSFTASQGGAGETAGAKAAGSLRLTGLVTATTSNGQPILHTPLGTLTLDTRTALPLGSSLALQIALPAAQDTPAAQALAAAWPSLESLEETVFQGLPAAQMEAVARALPQVGPRLASGMLFFLSALNQGNLSGWLSPAAAAAERGEHGDLFERLGREFAGLSRSIDTAAGEWRFVNLPLWSEQGLRELRCFFRHQDQGGGKGEAGGEKATRFVLELELERHGELQLDGLVRARRFDLLLRSRRPLPALARGDLMALFEEANAIAGYSGQLVFQASSDWLQLRAAQSADRPHEGVRV